MGPPPAGQRPAADREPVVWGANRRRADGWRDRAPGPGRTADPGRAHRGGGRRAHVHVTLRPAAGPRLPVLRDRHVRDRRAAGRGGRHRAGGSDPRRDRRGRERHGRERHGRERRGRPGPGRRGRGWLARDSRPPHDRLAGPARRGHPGPDPARHRALRGGLFRRVRHRGPGLRRPGADAAAPRGRGDPGAGRGHDRAGLAVRRGVRPLPGDRADRPALDQAAGLR